MIADNFDEGPALFKMVYVEPEIRTLIKEIESAMIQVENIHGSLRKLHSNLVTRDYTHGKL